MFETLSSASYTPPPPSPGPLDSSISPPPVPLSTTEYHHFSAFRGSRSPLYLSFLPERRLLCSLVTTGVRQSRTRAPSSSKKAATERVTEACRSRLDAPSTYRSDRVYWSSNLPATRDVRSGRSGQVRGQGRSREARSRGKSVNVRGGLGRSEGLGEVRGVSQVRGERGQQRSEEEEDLMRGFYCLLGF